MKVKLLIGRSGPSASWAANTVVDFEQRRAERLILAGEAIPVVDEPPIETAMLDSAPARKTRSKKAS